MGVSKSGSTILITIIFNFLEVLQRSLRLTSLHLNISTIYIYIDAYFYTYGVRGCTCCIISWKLWHLINQIEAMFTVWKKYTWTDGRRRPYCMKSSGTYCVFSIIMISLWQLYCLMVLGQV
jgi:hypothetical protein